MDDYTRKFSIVDDKDVEIYNILTTVYQALEEKGYNPINQIVGYILSEDPTYITNHMGARTLIRKLDRDELLTVNQPIKAWRRCLHAFFMCVNCRNILKSRCFGLMEKIAAIPTLTNWIKDVTIWLQFFQGSVCMSETKTEGLIYKGHPLRRIDNLIYYGTMADPYIVMMQILESKKENGLDMATKVSLQLQSTNPNVKARDRVVKKGEKSSLYEAMDFASIWLERALAGK